MYDMNVNEYVKTKLENSDNVFISEWSYYLFTVIHCTTDNTNKCLSCSERLRPHSPDKDEDSDAGNDKISIPINCSFFLVCLSTHQRGYHNNSINTCKDLSTVHICKLYIKDLL